MDTKTVFNRSVARGYILSQLDAIGESYMDYDVENMVTELVDSEDTGYTAMDWEQFDELMTRHQVEPEPEWFGSNEQLTAARCDQVKGEHPGTAQVQLFKASGKWYTDEDWRIPDDAIGPFDMIRSPDFRRIDGGAVLVDAQEPWGYPHLFPGRAR